MTNQMYKTDLEDALPHFRKALIKLCGAHLDSISQNLSFREALNELDRGLDCAVKNFDEMMIAVEKGVQAIEGFQIDLLDKRLQRG